MKIFNSIISIALYFLILPNHTFAQTEIFWGGGSGNWSDPAHWFKDAAGMNNAGVIPNSNSIVKFTNQSSPVNNWLVEISPGSYDVHSIIVETSGDFILRLNGQNPNPVVMNVFGDIEFLPNSILEYASSSHNENIWKFIGNNNHNISTGNNDLLNIEIHEAGVNFHQFSNIRVSGQIRMVGGIWNSNGHNVNSGKILFRDFEPSNASIPKVFNTAGSNILCEEWDSRLTYGSLEMNGAHQIYTNKFVGSPRQLNGPSFNFDEIHLLEYPDASSPLVEYFNFECTECVIENLIIEDTGITKLAGKFTIEGDLKVVNKESTIRFSSGNNRTEEVIINGTITTPKPLNCEKRTLFENQHSDFITIIRNSGQLVARDAIVRNMKATGGAVFTTDNGILEGSSTGWNAINPPQPLAYYWNPPANTVGDWNDPTNWVVQGGPAGCLPSIIDDVYIDDGSKGDIRIPFNYTAECNNFYWSNKDNLELTLDGSISLESRLKVAGHFDLNSSAIITGVNRHVIDFASYSDNYIFTRGVHLPFIRFNGEFASWSLEDRLSCDVFIFEGGTLNTQSEEIITDAWSSFTSTPKQFNFNSSTITVNGEMALSRTEDHNVSVNPGASHIICEDLICFVHELHDVEFINPSNITLDNYAYEFNSLILNGTGAVTTQNELVLNDLIFKADGSTLRLDAFEVIEINGGVESLASETNPAVFESTAPGNRVEIYKTSGNLCMLGFIELKDTESIISGVVHAPDGINLGNNLGINFLDGNANDLYWVGGSGSWNDQSNWSKVSGGCPTNKDPNNAPNLFFDNKGLFTNNEIIDVPLLNIANNLFFRNSTSLTLDIGFLLITDNIYLQAGFANMVGASLYVTGETSLDLGGFLTTDLTEYKTKQFNTTAGTYILRAGSNAMIEED